MLVLPGLRRPARAPAHARARGRGGPRTGTRAAAAGGYVAIFAMANTDPVVDTATRAQAASSRQASAEAVVPVGLLRRRHARASRGEQLTEMGELGAAGAVGFSDDGRPLATAALTAPRAAVRQGRAAASSPSTRRTTRSCKGGQMHEGAGLGAARPHRHPVALREPRRARAPRDRRLRGRAACTSATSAPAARWRPSRAQGGRRAGHRRGHAAPPDPHRRGRRVARPQPEDEPAAARRERPRRRSSRRSRAALHRLRRHRPRAARRRGEGRAVRGGAVRRHRPRDGLRVALRRARASRRARPRDAGQRMSRRRRASPGCRRPAIAAGAVGQPLRRRPRGALDGRRRGACSRARANSPWLGADAHRRVALTVAAGARRLGRTLPSPAVLVLEDGAAFAGEALAGSGHRRRRDRLHHQHDRLPGDRHRPVLLRAAHHLHVPDDRQLRRRRRTATSPARRTPAAIIAREITNYRYNRASREHVARLARRARRRRRDRRRHARPHAAHPRAAARCAPWSAPRPPTSSTLRKAAPGPAADGRPRPAPRSSPASEPYEAPAPEGGSGARSARRRLRLRHQALDPAATSPSAGCRVTVVPAQTSAREVLKLEPDGVLLSATAPATRRRSPTRSRPIERPARQGARLRHLPRPPAARLALGMTTYKLKFGHRGANHPVKDLRTGRGRDHHPEPRLRREGRERPPAPRSPTSTSTTAPSRASPSPERCTPSRCSTTPRRRPGPHDSLYLFERFRDEIDALQARRGGLMPRRDDLHKILIIGSGPDRHRPGLRVRLLGHPGLQGAARGGLRGRARQLATRRRS